MSCVVTFGCLIAGVVVASGCVKRRAGGNSQATKTTFAREENLPETRYEVLPGNTSSDHALTNDSKATIIQTPPQPQIEIVGPPPSKNVTWVPGHWKWESGWEWVSGHWEVLPSRDAAWIPGRWTRTANGWQWVEGYWRTASLR